MPATGRFDIILQRRSDHEIYGYVIEALLAANGLFCSPHLLTESIIYGVESCLRDYGSISSIIPVKWDGDNHFLVRKDWSLGPTYLFETNDP